MHTTRTRGPEEGEERARGDPGAGLLKEGSSQEELHLFFSFLISMDGGTNIKSTFICCAFKWPGNKINANLC